MNTQTQRRGGQGRRRRRRGRGGRDGGDGEEQQASHNDPATGSQRCSMDEHMVAIDQLMARLEFFSEYIDWLDRHRPAWRQRSTFHGF